MKKNKIFALSVAALAALPALAACGGGSSGGTTGGVKYTYNTYIDANPKTWNPHAWETSSDSYILAYTEMGFYDLGFNEDKSGYTFLCEMASDFPVDVTADLTAAEKTKYFGRSTINLPSGIAFDIPLNPLATWEDGTKITADDYIESMKRLLNPEFVNHRADSWYKGNTILANAERYFKNGQITVEPAFNFIKDDPNLESTDENFAYNDIWYANLGANTPYFNAIFSNPEPGNFYTVLNNRGSTAAKAVEDAAKRITQSIGEGLIKIRRDGVLDGVGQSSDWNKVETVSDIKTNDDKIGNMWDYSISELDFDQLDLKVLDGVIVNEAELAKDEKDLPDDYEEYVWEDFRNDVKTFVSGLGYPRGVASKSNAWRLPLFAEYENHYAGIEFENVGIEKIDDYKIRLVMDQASPVSMTDLKFSLTSNWLVNIPLYDKLTIDVAGTNLKGTKYGTASEANYLSYGPYRLAKFQDNKLISLVKNEKWYGYSDGKHEGQFQMEELDTQVISSHETAMQMFEKGEIDDIELTASDMKKYGTSRKLQFTPTSYTQKISFNVTRDMLKKRQDNAASGTHSGNKTILANEDFRKAFSLSIDRTMFASQCTAGSEGFTGLLNSLYISDVDDGEFYRGTPQGKSVYGKIYDHLGGSTIDDENGPALNSSANGYNSALAVQYFKRALDTEMASEEAGHFQKGDKIAIEILVFKTDSETTQASYKFLKDTLDDLAEDVNEIYGEDVVSFDFFMTPNEDYYDEAKKGAYDIIFSTWGGAQMNPWGLMEVYCDSTFDSNCEYGMTKRVGKIDITFDSDGDGEMETNSLEGWYNTLNGLKEIAETDYDMEDPEEAERYHKDKVARHQQRLNILSEIEAGYIKTWSTAPILSRSSASLTSFKVKYGTENYIPLMGYGGVRYMTFNYTNDEWAQALKDGTINADLYRK